MSAPLSTLLLLLALTTPAGDPDPPDPELDEIDRTRITLHGGSGISLRNDDTARMGAMAAQRFLRESVSVVVEFRMLDVRRAELSTQGGGTAILGRWHPLEGRLDPLFAEGGVGGVITGEAVPHGGTALNFSTHLGGGIDVSVAGRARLMGGVRWYHASNANLSRPNPGWDVIYGYLGLAMGVSRGG